MTGQKSISMKIAYIYPALTTIGGADRVISEKANYFAEVKGFEVFLITAHQNGLPLSFPLSPKVQHIDLEVNFDEQYKYSFFKRGLVYLKLIKIYKEKLSQLLNKLQVDITLTTISRDVDFLASLKDGSPKFAEAHVAKRFLRNNHLLQQRGGLYGIVGKIWANKLEKAIKEFAGLIVLTNNDAAKWKDLDKNKITVIPNAYPFYPAQKSNCRSKKIISVGRLEEQKGYDKLICAWEIVAKKHQDWTIAIYGEGSLHGELTKMVQDKNLTTSFSINKPVKNIIDKYEESSFLVLSSVFEGFGMVLVEAMACGSPVISFDCPDGPADIIKDGEDGFLVELGNINQLADRIEYLIEHEEKRIEMGKKAAENIKRYDPAIIMEKWVTLFEANARKR